MNELPNIEELLNLLEEQNSRIEEQDNRIEEQDSQIEEALDAAENWKSQFQELKRELACVKSAAVKEHLENSHNQNEMSLLKNQNEEQKKEIENLNSQNKSLKSCLESKDRVCKDEETLIRKKATAMYNEHIYLYDLKYQAKVVSHESFLFGCLLYGILVTLFTAVRSERFMSDFKTFFVAINDILNVAAEKLIFGASTVAKLGNKISHPTISIIAYWVIMIAVTALVVGVIGYIIYFALDKFIKYYKSNLLDNTSLTVVLVTMAVEVFFAEKIRAVIPINLLLLFLIVHLAYIAIRIYVSNCAVRRTGRKLDTLHS